MPGSDQVDCTKADPARLFCTDFEVDALEQVWGRPLSAAPSDTAQLDTGVFRSGTRAARFSVPNGGWHQVALRGEVPRTNRIEVSGWAYLDVKSLADIGTTALVSIAYPPDFTDGVSLRFEANDSHVNHSLGEPSLGKNEKFSLPSQPPLGRFFHFALTRDELNRTVSVTLDGERVLPPTALTGTRPNTTVMQITTGIVNSYDAKAPVSIVLDDLQVRRY
jgi:hypothetical protein